jgi:hypothetical protein
VHDTPDRLLLVAPAGIGTGWIDQLLPFQRSANVSVPALSENDPTAVQALAAVQDTEDRSLLVAPDGLGVGWMDQVVPFRRSANVTTVGLFRER